MLRAIKIRLYPNKEQESKLKPPQIAPLKQ